MVELSFDIALDAVLMAQGPLSLEKIQLTMNHTKTIIHGGLYDFVRDAKKRRSDLKNSPIKAFAPSPPLPSTPFDSNDLYQRISPIIPKVSFLINQYWQQT